MKNLRILSVLMIPGMIAFFLSNCNETGGSYDAENERLLIEKAINNSIGWAKIK